MAKNFFSSDYHLWHGNILKYEYEARKQFLTSQERHIIETGTPEDIKRLRIGNLAIQNMHNKIIIEHNQRVKSEDNMWFLGDFGFSASKQRAFRGEGQPYSPDEILSQMNGQWTFIMGNHDKPSNKLKTKTKEIILRIGGMNVQLIHDPTYARIEYSLILHGHIHSLWKAKELKYYGKYSLMLNVGVDVWKFRPVEWREVQTIYDRWNRLRSQNRYDELGKFFEEINK